jgi:hypothetical protein
MMSIFKTKKKEEVVRPTKSRSMSAIIEEIHETFFTEHIRLLAEAKNFNNTKTDKQHIINKSGRLNALGFSSSKECKEAKEEHSRISKLVAENKTKEELIEAINYFSGKYPLYKFITESSLIKICAKYNLIYGSVDNYIGTVPEKNLKEIENFKIQKEDECYIEEEVMSSRYDGRRMMLNSKFIDYDRYQQSKEYNKAESWGGSMHGISNILEKCRLEIAAPKEDFDTSRMQIENFKLTSIKILDPVVLQPVFFKGYKHYLIITAWGQEASDELVINNINN